MVTAVRVVISVPFWTSDLCIVVVEARNGRFFIVRVWGCGILAVADYGGCVIWDLLRWGGFMALEGQSVVAIPFSYAVLAAYGCSRGGGGGFAFAWKPGAGFVSGDAVK